MKFFLPCLIIMSSWCLLAEPCPIMKSSTMKAPVLHDPLYQVLSAAQDCPMQVMALTDRLNDAAFTMSSYMVANRGRFNPALGSFSFFEMASRDEENGRVAEIFMGHFTDLIDGKLSLDQIPSSKKLLVEAIAFDETKGLYNFYELIGNGRGATWFYRGDSLDALDDNTYLYREPPPGKEKFGRRMRCSACHTSGEPIMKELNAPHNDWWMMERALPFGDYPLSPEVLDKVSNLKDASHLAQSVKMGMTKLYQSTTYKRASFKRSLPEIVRPLFCTTEINLASSTGRLKDDQQQFTLPPEFVLHPLLGAPALSFKKDDYEKLLHTYDLNFPETNEIDADHMWLSPVVSTADLMALESLMAAGLVSQKFAMDVLMVDFTKPAFSKRRCKLLSFVPESTENWLPRFLSNLERSNDPDAQNLARTIKDEDSLVIHEQAIKQYVDNLAQKPLEDLFKTLLKSRSEVFTSEISKNPRGQILEPGFRVIFPQQNGQ